MNAYLLLANGMVFAGQSVGAEGVTVGEVVFATGMVGFEETLTDPSYYGQIITQTYPLIGNYGMNQGDMESDRIWARGYIVREACTTPSNWRCEETLDSFLKKNNTIGIILCTETDSDVARYSTLAKNDQMFAAKYKLYLPDKEDLRREIERQKELYLMAHPEENDKE